jgi:hypothetical protein
MPGFQPPDGWPQGREPGARIRLVPNETLPGPLGDQPGELVQTLVHGRSWLPPFRTQYGRYAASSYSWSSPPSGRPDGRAILDQL